MGNIIVSFFTFALIIVSLFLVFIILLQRGSTNAGLGTAFGGGLAESTFGADAGNILTKGTIFASVAFFIISFGLYLGYIARVGNDHRKDMTLPVVGTEKVSDESTTEAAAGKPNAPTALEETPSLDELQVNTPATPEPLTAPAEEAANSPR